MVGIIDNEGKVVGMSDGCILGLVDKDGDKEGDFEVDGSEVGFTVGFADGLVVVVGELLEFVVINLIEFSS